jgi:hypothetical protein
LSRGLGPLFKNSSKIAALLLRRTETCFQAATAKKR